MRMEEDKEGTMKEEGSEMGRKGKRGVYSSSQFDYIVCLL